jgi:hypothetical protein
MRDVEPHLYATVIREMLRHENDVANHRIMWLLIVQGLIANAAVSAGRENREVISIMAGVGILVTLSAFVILYKSYQARGYLQFLGNEARQGTLRPEDLPLLGWPPNRVKGWRQKVWACAWIGDFSELLEPFFFLPGLLILAWTFVLFRCSTKLGDGILLILAALLMALQLSLLCRLWVWWQGRNEKESQLHRNGPTV